MRIRGKHLALAAALLAGTAFVAQVPVLRTALLASPAYALAGNASAEDISIETDAATYTIKRIDATGTTLTSGELEALFDDESKATIAERLAKLTAAGISMAEVIVEVEIGDAKQTITYKDVKFANVAKGVAGAASIGSAAFAVSGGKEGEVTGTISNIAARNIDLAAILHAHLEARADDKEPLKVQYESISIDGLVLKAPKGVAFSVGKMSGKDIAGRALAVPFSQIAAKIAELSSAKPAPTQEQQRELASIYADLARSSSFALFEMRDMKVAADVDGKAGGFALGRMAVAGFGGGKLGEIAYEGLSFDVPDAKFSFGGLSMRGFDFRPLLVMADSFAKEGDSGMVAVDPRAFVPTLDHVGLTNLDLDAAAQEGQKGNADNGTRNKFKLAGISLDMSGHLGGIPTSATMSLDHLAVDLSGMANDPDMKDFVAMGYSKVDLSAKADLDWNEATSELALKSLSVQNAGMGALTVSATLGNVTKDLFASDPSAMMAAALGALVKKVELGIVNDGLLDKALASAAAKEGKKPEDMRQTMIAGVSLGIPQILGDSPASRTIANAVAKFLAAPKNLKITAVSAQGLGAGDLGLLNDPPALLGKLDVKASVNQ